MSNPRYIQIVDCPWLYSKGHQRPIPCNECRGRRFVPVNAPFTIDYEAATQQRAKQVACHTVCPTCEREAREIVDAALGGDDGQ